MTCMVVETIKIWILNLEQDWLDLKWSWGWIWNSGVGVGIGVEISGVGIGVGVETSGVGVDILEICRSWSWSWSWNSWSWSWYSGDWPEVELELEPLELELSWYYGVDPNPDWLSTVWAYSPPSKRQKTGPRHNYMNYRSIDIIVQVTNVPSRIFWSNSSSVGSINSHPSGGGFLLRFTLGMMKRFHFFPDEFIAITQNEESTLIKSPAEFTSTPHRFATHARLDCFTFLLARHLADVLRYVAIRDVKQTNKRSH